MAFAPAEGSLACLFGTCRENLEKLLACLPQTSSDASNVSEAQRCANEIGRFDMWNTETGVAQGQLDYGLRWSSMLRDGVMELLQDLESITHEAISISTGTFPYLAEDERQYTVPDTSGGHSSSSSEPGSGLSQSSSSFSSPLNQRISEAHDIIACLVRQISALQDPAPHDIITNLSYEGVGLSDQSNVRSKFPKADRNLLDRLGSANWKRRQQLMSLRSKQQDIIMKATCDEDIPISIEDGENDLTLRTVGSTYSQNYEMAPGSETTHEMSFFSGPDSVLETAMTSLTDKSKPIAADIDRPVAAVEVQRLKLPRPPEPASSFNGQQFKCPYCFHELVEVLSFSSWKEHVMRDLEPYICTFGGCTCPAKTYGLRGDWIKHEIDIHEIQNIWSCRPCDEDFNSRTAFDDHMQERHPGLATKRQLDLFAELCEQSPKKLKCRTQCPLCLEERRTNKKLRTHLADHLEQIALFAALPPRSGIESEDELDLMEDSVSDGETRAESMLADPEGLDANGETRNAVVRRFLDDRSASALSENDTSQDRAEASPSRGVSRRSTVQFPILTIGHPENEFFYGRDKDILELHQCLAIPGEICVIHGVGGVGKTLTSVEYAYRYREAYDCIFWLQADTAPGLAESYGEIAHCLKLVQGSEDQARILELSREWMETTERRWLLIYDNVEDWDLVLQYLPRDFYGSRGSVLVTTQDSGLISKVKHNLSLKTFGAEEGSAMLLEYLERPSQRTDYDRGIAQEISGLVGGLPVAISHVAGYVAYSRCTLRELLEIFKQRRRHIGAATSEDDDLPAAFRQASFSYDETLGIVWDVTLRELSADAQDLTYILAYLNCEAVPESMLCTIHPEAFLEFLDTRESIRYERMKNSLVDRRLVNAKYIDGKPCLSLHRSLQRSIKNSAAKNPFKQQQVFSQALVIVRKVFPTSSPIQVPEPQKWREHQWLLPHVMSLRKAFVEAKSAIQGSQEFAGLLSDAGINQYEQGFTQEGLLLLKTAEQILEPMSFDGASLMRADISTIIALMGDNTGISARAEGLNRREAALNIRKQHVEDLSHVSRNDEILHYNAWMDYAISLLQHNRYEEAEPILDSCLEKYREWGSPAEIPFEYGKYYHKMAFVRMYQGRYDEALAMAEIGVQNMGIAGSESLMLRFKFDFACVHLQSGDVDGAIKLHNEVLRKRISVCGKANENTLQSYYAVGALHELRDNYLEAEHWFRLAIDHRRAASWSTEAVARTQYHFSRVLRAQDKDPERATKNYEEAKAALARLLPLDLPATLKDVKDEEVLFDHLLTVYGGRFTGTKLLAFVR